MSIRRIQQLSDSHCGPAVLTMLLSAIGITISQEDVVRAAGVTETIEEYGTHVTQLARASAILAPTAIFWHKQRASLDDIRYLLHIGYAVGIEWQGLFYENEQEERMHDTPDNDRGHYSIITNIDEYRKELITVDPYKDFANQDRIISIPTFMRRWWDTSEVKDPYSGIVRVYEDKQLLFFVTPSEADLPLSRGFLRFYHTF